MSGASDYLENAWLDLVLRGTAFASPTNVYLALFSSDPADDASGTELSGSNYARVTATGGFDAPAKGVTQNSAALSFPTPSADWTLATHWAIFDASVGGNLLVYGAIGTPFSGQSGGVVRINAGDLRIAAVAGSDYLNNALINHVLRATAYTAPSARYVGLHLGAGATIGAEISGSNYARTAATFAAASGGVAANSVGVTFPSPSGDWGLAQYLAIYDAATSGNALFAAALDKPRYITTSDPVEFGVGDLSVEVL